MREKDDDFQQQKSIPSIFYKKARIWQFDDEGVSTETLMAHPVTRRCEMPLIVEPSPAHRDLPRTASEAPPLGSSSTRPAPVLELIHR